METILTGAEARSKLLVGVNKLANSIKGTLGPNARTVVIQNPMGGMPVIINDGVSIARMVNDKDPYVQMGIDLLKEVASEAQQKSGDGTTSATLIAQTLCNGSLTLMENGTSPLVIRDALKSYLAATEEYVRESAIEDFDLKDVATIAANNDGELGELIAGVVKRGQGITIERSPTNETYVKRASGFEMNAGYAHALMANAPRAKCEFDNPMVLTTTEKISTFNALVPALEAAVKQNKPLVIFCSDFNGQMLQNLLVNIVQGKVSVCMIKPAGMPEQQQAWLEDVAAATGAKLFKVSLNESIVNITSDDLGSCEKFVSSQTNTILSIKETDELGEYIDELTQLEDEAENDWLAEQYHNRAKRLGKGISTIYVGETKERVDDAVNACKLALSSGVVIGGGATLYGAANELDEQGDVADLFRDALKTPLRTIISNTGDEPNLGLVLSGENYVCGKTAEVRNAIEDGVLDPMQVVLNSLESAVSIASLVLMTDAAIIAPSD
jgi:chaperonin GroEL